MPDIRAITLCAALMMVGGGVFQGPALAGDSHGTVAESLAENLVGHATIDGAGVTDVRERSDCVTEFTTAAGHPAVDWSKIDDPQVRYNGRYMVLPVQHDGAISQLRILRGVNANRVRSSFTLLYLDCHPK